MTTNPSSRTHDPSLLCAYFGGPRDGFKSADLPTQLSGKRLTGAVSRVPLGQPAQYSLFARYVCKSESQIDGFWQFHFEGLEGPNGEALVTTEMAQASRQMTPELRELCVRALRDRTEDLAFMTDSQLRELVRNRYPQNRTEISTSDETLTALLKSFL